MFRCLNHNALNLQCTWEESLPLAGAAGFEGSDVEIKPGGSATQIAEALAGHDLRPGGAMRPMNFMDAAAVTKDGLAEIEKTARIAAEIGCRRFTQFILSFSDELTWKENFRFHVDQIRPIARVLADHGCRIGLEFLGPKTLREGHNYSFIHTMHPMLDLCEQIGPNCGLLLDSWHWYTSLGTVEEILALRPEQVVYVHVNDAPEGIPLEQHHDLDRCLPGETGVIDLAGFLGALRTIGYDGPVTPEPFIDEFKEMPPEEVLNHVGSGFAAAWERPARPRLPERMNVIAIGDGKAWIEEKPVPQPEGNQVVIKLHASPLCGSNMRAFREEGGCTYDGHEGAGEVVAVAHSTRLKVGDRVGLAPVNACGVCEHCRRGDVIFCRDRPAIHPTFAQYTKTADVMCTPLPDDVGYPHGSLLGCGLGPAFEALKCVGARAFEPVVISGLGPVGLGAVALGAYLGAEVIGLDPEPYRRDLALDLGAAAALDPTGSDIQDRLRELTRDRGIAYGVDCSGQESSERLLIDCAAVRGKIALVGENRTPLAITPSNDFIRKGLTLMGCWHMNMNDCVHVLDFLRRAPDQADKLISHTFPFDRAQEAFDMFAGRRTAKVVLLPWG